MTLWGFVALRRFALPIALAALLAFSCSQKKESPQPPQSEIVVEWIIDGDTFIMSDGSKIRISGIDTPEQGESLCAAAGAFLSDLILNKQVTIKRLAGGDRYGRLLAEVFVDTIDVGARILRAGLGYLYLFDDNVYLRDRYLKMQISAMDEHRGIWSLPPPQAEDFYCQVKGSFRFHRPLCTSIKNVQRRKMKTFKNRDEALRRGLSPCRNCKP